MICLLLNSNDCDGTFTVTHVGSFLIVRNCSEHSRGLGSISDDPCISCELGASEPSTGSEKDENKPDENRIQTNSHDVSVSLVSVYECVKDKYSHIFYLFNIWILCSVMCVQVKQNQRTSLRYVDL